ncbi:hypothetical protein J6590_004040 [Homalodisca vitripennis]|nr:hypothetical protein J6590_004040 [Homalodisca vitripennis]
MTASFLIIQHIYEITPDFPTGRDATVAMARSATGCNMVAICRKSRCNREARRAAAGVEAVMCIRDRKCELPYIAFY